jgi:glycosyltransferase involved in cell wall biosynthesis
MEASELARYRVGVVIPAYKVERQIQRVIRGLPAWVSSIIVVDDASPDATAARVRDLGDPRVTLLVHESNGGVGMAMRTGLQEALRQELDVVVKLDGDDQMDPGHLPRFVAPLVDGRADVSKGNRYHSVRSLTHMPLIRMAGNAVLSFLVKLASGYWSNFDPANGYIALRGEILRGLHFEKLSRRYFFESGLMIELGIMRAVVADVPIDARYGDEQSSLSIGRTVIGFPPRLMLGLLRRLVWYYLVRDFNAVSVFLLVGSVTFLGGSIYGLSAWIDYGRRGEYAPAGMVMLAAMPVILGFQMLLQAILLDVNNVPRTPLCAPLRPRPEEP